MKKLIYIVCALAISTAALAHSGGTDSLGCHTDRKTGIRHCH